MKKIFILTILVFGLFVNFSFTNPAPCSAIVPEFSVSPNPVHGNTFEVSFAFTQNSFPNAQISISNLLGQVVYSYFLTKADYAKQGVQVDLADAKLVKGVYLLQVKSGKDAKTLKLAIR